MGRRLYGRDGELALLRSALAEVPEGAGVVVLVAGEAGIGKSRLVAELAADARGAGLRVLTGRTTEDDGAPPHWPWLQVLAPLGADGILLAPAGADPEAERFARQAAVAAAVLDTPTLLVLEDVHRADAASLRLLVHVAYEVAQRPAALVATFRTDPADQAAGFGAALDEIQRASRVERVDLRGLDLAAVTDLLGPAATPEAAARVLEVSDGNPLLVGEWARHLSTGGSPDVVPLSVRESVRRRLQARSADCVDAVRWAAVSGRAFSARRLAEAAGRPAAALLGSLDEAVDAGVLEPTGEVGGYRFVHALIRDAVAGTMGAAELARRHRALALAIESLDGTGDDRAADLARHWDAAAALGDREVAAAWCDRAAAVADRQLAWDEAARLFDRALALGGPADPLVVVTRTLGSARARLHCDDIGAAVERCVLAGRTALGIGRPDLVAEAVVVPETRGVASRELYDLGEAALAGLDASAHPVRARLHAQLVSLGFYLGEDPATLEHHAAAAEAEAARTAEPHAEMAAIRARLMLAFTPADAELRLRLAERLGFLARAARMPTVAVWDPLWRMDVLLETGRLPEAVALLPLLRAAVSAAGTPIARWHLVRTEGHLAQAAGRFADAVRYADEARDIYARLEGPLGAEMIHLTQLMWIGMHAGDIPGVAERLSRAPVEMAPPLLGEMPLLGSAEAYARLGDRDGALRLYERLSPAEGWSLPPHLGLYPWAMRLHMAAVLGRHDDIPPLLAAVDAQRGLHVGSKGGTISYLGPLELWIGIATAALGRWDDADRDLATAVREADRVGAVPFAVHAAVERAAVLTARDGPGDAAEAARLLATARPVAARLGMPGFLARIDAAVAAAPAAPAGPLSPREAEVAALVARGLTNREIARRLFISERTAQNHVQHILTKLDLGGRREIAAWHRAGQRDTGDPRRTASQSTSRPNDSTSSTSAPATSTAATATGSTRAETSATP